MAGLGTRGLLALFIAAAVAPPVAAQTQPGASLSLEGLPEAEVSTDGTSYLELFDVHLVLRQIACRGAAEFTVNLAATAADAEADPRPEVAFTFAPSAARFRVAAGQYVTEPYDERLEVGLIVEPARIPHGGMGVGVEVAATLPAGSQECTSNGPMPSQSDRAEYAIEFRRGTEPAPPTSPTPEMPGLEGVAAVGALIVGAWAARRRRL